VPEVALPKIQTTNSAWQSEIPSDVTSIVSPNKQTISIFDTALLGVIDDIFILELIDWAQQAQIPANITRGARA